MRTIALLLAMLLPLTADAEPYRVKRYRELQIERQARHARMVARENQRVGFQPARVLFFPARVLPSRYETRFVIRDLETGRIQVVEERP